MDEQGNSKSEAINLEATAGSRREVDDAILDEGDGYRGGKEGDKFKMCFKVDFT